MRKLLFSLLTLAALCGGVCAQYVTLPGFPPGVFQDRGAIDAPASGGPSYAFIGYCTSASSTGINTCSLNLGANATCFVLVGTGAQNGTAVAGTVGGVALSSAITDLGVAFLGASLSSCSGSQTVVITWTGADYSDQGLAVWVLTGLSSTTANQTVDASGMSPTGSISVVSGTFLFAYGIGNPGTGASAITFATSSTEVPTRQDTPQTPGGGSGFYFVSADWIAPTNGTFSLVLTTGYPGGGEVGATYK